MNPPRYVVEAINRARYVFNYTPLKELPKCPANDPVISRCFMDIYLNADGDKVYSKPLRSAPQLKRPANIEIVGGYIRVVKLTKRQFAQLLPYMSLLAIYWGTDDEVVYEGKTKILRVGLPEVLINYKE